MLNVSHEFSSGIFKERCNDRSKTAIGPFKYWNREPIKDMEPWFLGYFDSGHILFLGPLKKILRRSPRLYNQECRRKRSRLM